MTVDIPPIRSAMVLCAVVSAVAFATIPSTAVAEDNDEQNRVEARATLQERFAPKEGRGFAHATGTTIVRDDFFYTYGYGVDAGYFFNETWGIEVRAFHLHTRLTHAGDQLREEEGLVPDMRAPDALFAAGGRRSWGYGKVLTLGRFVVHFDPQLVFHGGITLAEGRIAPTLTTGIGFLTHFRHGIQVKLDLQMSLHLERRNRGIVPATGFVPVLGVGWSPQWGGPS